MAHVILLDSLNEDVFVCGYCKSVYNCLKVFLEHKQLECRKSAQEQNTILNTNAPMTVASNTSDIVGDKPPDNTEHQIWPKDLICTLCKKKFKKMKTFITHMKTHNEKPYQCRICGRCFVQNSHLQRHIVSHKMWPRGLNETTPKSHEMELLSYTCLYCNLVSPNYTHYRLHLKHHWPLKKYKCIQGECMDFYDTVEFLLDHVAIAHNNPKFLCHKCNSAFSTLEEIAMHQQSHNNATASEKAQGSKQKQYKCSQCDATFRKPEKLSMHMHTEDHRKVCIHCNKVFTSDKRLRLHLQIHRMLKPFQCNICSSSFHMKKYLSSHMLKHGSRQYQCSVCKYMFKRQDLLQRHMKLHQPKKMLKCPFKDTLDCKKEFSRNDKLKLHINSHMKHVSFKTTTKQKPSQDSRGLDTQNNVQQDTKITE